MSLYCLIVEHEGETFTTQFSGASVHEAAQSFFADPMAASALPPLKPEHIIYVQPMEDLINAWAICAGLQGRYVNITAVKVNEEPDALSV